MSHVRIASFALAGLVFSTLGAAPQQPGSVGAGDAVRMLIARNSALEKRNSELEQQVKTLQIQLADYQKLQGLPEPKTLPPGWKSGKFNGMTIYVVPCEMDNSAPAKSAMTPAK